MCEHEITIKNQDGIPYCISCCRALYKCKICKKEFKDKIYLKRHSNIHKIVCPRCNINHCRKSGNGGNRQRYCCNNCKKRFILKETSFKISAT